MFMDIDDVLSQKPYGVIYCLTCKVNGKVYIGQTTDFLKRMGAYKRLECKNQIKIYRALKKHGPENFSYDIIDITVNEALLDFLEDFYIEIIGSKKRGVGYNIRKGGGHGKHSEETINKMSHRTKLYMSKKENRDIISKANKGKKHSEESKQKMAEAWKLRQPRTEEHKRKIGDGNRGKVRSEEVKKENGKHFLGKKHSKESIERMSKTQKDRFSQIALSRRKCKKKMNKSSSCLLTF